MQSGLFTKSKSSISKLRGEVEQQAIRILAQVQEEIIALNTNGQLLKGIDSKGQKLKPKYRNVRYKKAKNSVNPLAGFGTPDLKLTGSFYKNFYLTPKGKSFELFSSDEKADKLADKYGDEIFGLTVENEEIVNLEIILPKLQEWILKRLKI